jgi:hypothetical protein
VKKEEKKTFILETDNQKNKQSRFLQSGIGSILWIDAQYHEFFSLEIVHERYKLLSDNDLNITLLHICNAAEEELLSKINSIINS